jgi:hypothetical protein
VRQVVWQVPRHLVIDTDAIVAVNGDDQSQVRGHGRERATVAA